MDADRPPRPPYLAAPGALRLVRLEVHAEAHPSSRRPAASLRLPLVLLPEASGLCDPRNEELAGVFGPLGPDREPFYSGDRRRRARRLAAAVYATSEGITTGWSGARLRRQAGLSSRSRTTSASPPG